MGEKLKEIMEKYHLDVLDLPNPISIMGKTDDEILRIVEAIGRHNLKKENDSFREALTTHQSKGEVND